MSAPTVSKRPLLTLIGCMSGVTLAEIDKLFVGNGLEVERDDYVPSQWNASSGERRNKAAGYVSAIDTSDEVQRVRLLRVIDDVLGMEWWDESAKSAFIRELRRDEVEIDGDTLDPRQLRLSDRSRGRLDAALPDFAAITNVGVLREHAERMQRALLERGRSRCDPRRQGADRVRLQVDL